MENQDKYQSKDVDYIAWDRKKSRGKVFTGVIVIFFGVLFLLRELGIHIPREIFHPSTIFIIIGLYILIKNRFRKTIGYLLVIVGVLLKVNHYYPDIINMRLVWPIVLIAVGLSILLKSIRQGKRVESCRPFQKHKKNQDGKSVSPEDFVDGISVFGGVKRTVTSQNFKGADVVTIFGGTELNFSQADFDDQVIVNLTTIFGGTEIIVPSNWHIRTEIVTIFGAVEDNRYSKPIDHSSEKILILKGTCMLGGVEIKSFIS